MRKIIFILYAILIADQSQAQFYGGVSVGYGLPFGTFTSNYYSSTQTQQGVVNYSLGKGFYPQIFVGYPITNGVHVELGGLFGFGFNSGFAIQDSSSNDDVNFSASGFNLTPSIVIDPCEHFGHFSFFTRFGLNIGLGIQEKQTFEYVKGSYTEKKTIMNTYNSMLGLTGGLGLNYELNKSNTIFIEIDATTMSATPKKGEYKVYEINGKDQLPSLSGDFKSWTYVDERSKLNAPVNEHFGNRSSFSRATINFGTRFRW